MSEEEWTQTKQLVEEFQAAGGVGERLQKGLERRARKTENWVSSENGALSEAQVGRGSLAVACWWPPAEFLAHSSVPRAFLSASSVPRTRPGPE